MKDTVHVVMLCSPKGKPQRKVSRRILGGQLYVKGSICTLTKNTLPFEPVQYIVHGATACGTPMVRPK